MECLAENRCFGGWHRQYRHASSSTGCDMQFAVYTPPQAELGKPLPVWYWLSGLTCTDANFMQKAGAQQIASELGLVLVAPDTSPRGDAVADDDDYDLGQGAGFYVNATQSPWRAHYQMYDYVVEELPALIGSAFPVSDRRAISGHSMGGHGALMIALRNPDRYRAATAFSPICNPIDSPWGKKAFAAYLGDDPTAWAQYDSTVLMQQARKTQLPMLVSQGLADEFLDSQLAPQSLQNAASEAKYPLTLEQHENYDHSYFFIASFIAQHARFVASHLA